MPVSRLPFLPIVFVIESSRVLLRLRRRRLSRRKSTIFQDLPARRGVHKRRFVENEKVRISMARYLSPRLNRCNERARACTNPRDKGRILTASKFSAGFADRGPGNRRNSAWREGEPPRLRRVWLPPTEAPLDSYLTFKYILCLLHLNTAVYSRGIRRRPSLHSLFCPFRFARARARVYTRVTRPAMRDMKSIAGVSFSYWFLIR